MSVFNEIKDKLKRGKIEGDFKDAKQKENLKYLKELKTVVIPPEYTFWVHHTTFNIPERKGTYEKSWEAIPTKDFVVRSEMSFIEAFQWVWDKVKYNRKELTYTYTCPKGNLPFRIILIQPRHNHLEEMFEGDELKKRIREENGLGDGRHPKASGKTHLLIFACKNKGKKASEIDTIYVVREQDLDDYVSCLKRIDAQNIEAESEQDYLGIDVKDGIVKENNETKTLIKSKSFSRFKEYSLDLRVGKIIKYAPYKREFLASLKGGEKQELEKARKL